MKASLILAKAEMCWRDHIYTMAVSASAVEALVLRDGAGNSDWMTALGNSTFLPSLLKVIEPLRDPSIPFHPKSCGRHDLVDTALKHIETYALTHPLSTLEIALYFVDNREQKRKLAKSAILTIPKFLRPYYIIKEFLSNPNQQLDLQRKLHQLGIKHNGGPVGYTPLTQMAIGHIGKYLDSKLYLDALRAKKDTGATDIWVHSDYSATETITTYLKLFDKSSSASRSLTLVPVTDLKSQTLELLATIYNANPEPEWFDVTTRSSVAKSPRGPSPTNIVLLHLRTANYKHNDFAPTMRIRSVKPESYASVYSYLTNNGHRPIQVTADNPPMLIDGAEFIHVTTKEGEFLQWSAYSRCSFVVATQSGISHLLELGPQKAYLSNYTCVPVDAHIRNLSLLHCKRLTATAALLHLTRQERLSLLIYQWGHGDSPLVDYANVRDLGPEELRDGMIEFMQLQESGTHPYTLYQLLFQTGLQSFSACIPDINLAETTFLDFVCILCYDQ